MEPYHLESYVDSEAFRFNHRGTDDGGRFLLGLNGAAGKRLTYKALIGDDNTEVLLVNGRIVENDGN